MEPDRKKKQVPSGTKQGEKSKKPLEGIIPQECSALSEAELHKKLEQAREMNLRVQHQIDLLYDKLGVKQGDRKEFMAKIAAKSPELYKMILEERKKWAELTDTVKGSKELAVKEKKEDPERGRKALKARNRNWISMR